MTGTGPLSRQERRHVVRDMVIAGATSPEIIDLFVAGFEIRDAHSPYRGRHAKASVRTVRGDLKAIAHEYQERRKNTEHDDRGAGAALDRLSGTASAAAAAGKFGAAVRADVQVLKHTEQGAQRHPTFDEHLHVAVDESMGRRPTRFTKPRGRRPKLTRAIIEKVADGIRLELTQEESAVYAGISEQSFYNYRDQGEADRRVGKGSIFVEFVEALERAQVHVKARCMATINKAIDGGSWQAAFRLLECRHPEQFARRSALAVNAKVNVTSDAPAVVRFDLRELEAFTPEQLRAAAYATDDDDTDPETT